MNNKLCAYMNERSALQVLVIRGIHFQLMRSTQKRENLYKLKGGVKQGILVDHGPFIQCKVERGQKQS